MSNPHNPEWWRSPATLLALLFLALATMFLFGGDRGSYYRPYKDSHVSMHNMGIVYNLSLKRPLFRFSSQNLDADGSHSYKHYNRFPILGYILIKLVTLPFSNDLSASLFAARMLMLTFTTGAAWCAYLALGRLVGDRWTALAATLLAFSSYNVLYYNDVVSMETGLDLFAVLLVFHGMAVSSTENRHGQLLAKTCVALSLGWHSYAILGPFVLFGLMAALRHRDGRAARRHVRLGVVAVLFGSMVLMTNFMGEYVREDGKVSWAELPSVKSALYRLGVAKTTNFDWLKLAKTELYALGFASVPAAVSGIIKHSLPICGDNYYSADEDGYRILGISVVLCTLILFVFSSAVRYRLPLVSLAMLKPCWLLVIPYYRQPNYESLFYFSIPLTLCVLVLTHFNRGGRGHVVVGFASVLLFV